MADKNYKLKFKMSDGTTQEVQFTSPQGETGVITSVERTSGDGTPGTKDTYTIRTNYNETFTFDVYNGKDGSGSVISVNGKDGTVTLGKDDVGLGNVDNVKQYSADNPPPYPVTSVNEKTGAVSLSATDVGLGNVDNIQQYSASNPPPYPVTSVNGQTGAVTVEAGTDATAVNNLINAKINRTTAVNAADTNYTTYMARGQAIVTEETTPTVNGAIAWLVE